MEREEELDEAQAGVVPEGEERVETFFGFYTKFALASSQFEVLCGEWGALTIPTVE